MHKLSSVLFAAFFLFAVLPDARAAVDEPGAQALKKHVTDALALQAETSKSAAHGLTMGGDVTVAPKGGFYEITIPDLAFVFGDAEGKLQIGTVIAEAVPGAVADEYALTVKPPSSLTAYDAQGKVAAEITIGRQELTGLWRPLLGTLIKADADYGDIKIKLLDTDPQKPAKSTVEARIAAVKAKADFNEAADKTWSGVKTFKADDISLVISGVDNGSITIAGMASDTSYEKMDLVAAAEITRKTLAMLRQDPPATLEEQKAFFESATSNIGAFGDASSSTVEIIGIKGDIRPGKDAEMPTKNLDPVRFSLAKLRSFFDVKGMSQEKGRARTTLKMEGLKVEDQKEDVAGLIPSDLNLDISFDDLPMRDMSKLFGKTFSDAMESAIKTQDAAGTVQEAQQQAQGQQKALANFATLPQLLARAGSSVTVADTYMRAADLSSTIEGKFKASEAAGVPAIGTLTVAFAGLDEAIAKLQALSQKPDADPRTAGIAQGLILLQMQGQPGKGAEGKTTRTYKFEATPEGKMLLNGVDMSMMMGMMGAMGGGAPAPVPSPAPAPQAAP